MLATLAEIADSLRNQEGPDAQTTTLWRSQRARQHVDDIRPATDEIAERIGLIMACLNKNVVLGLV